MREVRFVVNSDGDYLVSVNKNQIAVRKVSPNNVDLLCALYRFRDDIENMLVKESTASVPEDKPPNEKEVLLKVRELIEKELGSDYLCMFNYKSISEIVDAAINRIRRSIHEVL